MPLSLAAVPGWFRHLGAGDRMLGMPRFDAPIRPMTVGNMRRNGVRGLYVTRQHCGRVSAIVSLAAGLGIDVPATERLASRRKTPVRPFSIASASD
jgi:hypothetical protein